MLILFDVDDTLLDQETSVRLAATTLHRLVASVSPVHQFCDRWIDALERHFARYLRGEVSYQGQRRDRVREVVDLGLTDEAADRIVERYITAYEANWCLFPDVIPCLDRLSGCRLGVVSNGQGEQQRKKLVQSGIIDRFEHVLISEEIGCAKPDSTIFRRACALFGTAPSESIYIGDRYETDAQAARMAGLRGIWLDRRREVTDEHEPPLIHDLHAISPGGILQVHGQATG